MRLPSLGQACDRALAARLVALLGLLAVWGVADPHPPVEPGVGCQLEQGPPANFLKPKNRC